MKEDVLILIAGDLIVDFDEDIDLSAAHIEITDSQLDKYIKAIDTNPHGAGYAQPLSEVCGYNYAYV